MLRKATYYTLLKMHIARLLLLIVQWVAMAVALKNRSTAIHPRIPAPSRAQNLKKQELLRAVRGTLNGR